MVKIQIKIKGMHCVSCELLIKDILEELEGVKDVEAFFKTGEVNVDFDNLLIQKEEILAALKQEGYGGEVK